MNLKNRNDPDFLELCQHVKNGYETFIADWFNRHEISRKPKLQKDLALRILNSYYFFSFQTISTNISFIKNETLRRELAVLQHFKLENQLLLFSPACIDNVDSSHFSVIKKSKKNKEILRESSKLVFVAARLLSEEKFEDIKKINNFLGWNVLEQKSNVGFFHYKEKSSRGCFSMEIDEPLFCPKFEAAFNLTETKKDFLKSLGVNLPTLEESWKMHDLMLVGLKKDPFLNREENVNKVQEFISIYSKQKFFLDLNENIPDNEGYKKGRVNKM